MSGAQTNPPNSASFETASWLRRIGALAIDWVASTFVAIAIIGLDRYGRTGGAGFVPLLVFWAETTLGVVLAGGSFGQLATRIRVRRTDGSPLGPGRAALRQLAVCLVIPPLVFRPDGRGLHDLWSESAAYRLSPGLR